MGAVQTSEEPPEPPLLHRRRSISQENGKRESLYIEQNAKSTPPLRFTSRYSSLSTLPKAIPTPCTPLDVSQWVCDADRDKCTGCDAEFNFLLRRRHHCRICGEVFCHSCSSRALPVKTKGHRRRHTISAGNERAEPHVNYDEYVRACQHCYTAHLHLPDEDNFSKYLKKKAVEHRQPQQK